MHDSVEPRKSFSPSANAIMLAAMIAEVTDATSAEERRGFFRSIGRQIATLLPLDNVENAQELAARIDDLWMELGWGTVVLTVDDQGIDVLHRDMALLPGASQDIGDEISCFLLEGAYDSWFRSMGSGPRLQTRTTRQSEGTIELRHGL